MSILYFQGCVCACFQSRLKVGPLGVGHQHSEAVGVPNVRLEDFGVSQEADEVVVFLCFWRVGFWVTWIPIVLANGNSDIDDLGSDVIFYTCTGTYMYTVYTICTYMYTHVYIYIHTRRLQVADTSDFFVEMMVGMLLCQIFNSWSFNSLNLSKSVPSVSFGEPKSPDISRFRFHLQSARIFPKESTNKFGGLHRLQVPWRWWWLCEHRWWGGRKRLLGGRKRLFDPLQSTEVAMFQRFTTAVEKEYLLLCHWKGRLKIFIF